MYNIPITILNNFQNVTNTVPCAIMKQHAMNAQMVISWLRKEIVRVSIVVIHKLVNSRQWMLNKWANGRSS